MTNPVSLFVIIQPITHKGKAMTQEQLETIHQLRLAGHAVIIWTPKELAGASPDDVEDMSISYGFALINNIKPETDE